MDNLEGARALFFYATEGIVVVNEAGEIAHANPSAEKLFGYEKNKLIGKKIETLIPKKFTSSHQHHREAFNQNPHARAMGSGMDFFPADLFISH